LSRAKETTSERAFTRRLDAAHRASEIKVAVAWLWDGGCQSRRIFLI
jgi:hypothetical protein